MLIKKKMTKSFERMVLLSEHEHRQLVENKKSKSADKPPHLDSKASGEKVELHDSKLTSVEVNSGGVAIVNSDPADVKSQSPTKGLPANNKDGNFQSEKNKGQISKKGQASAKSEQSKGKESTKGVNSIDKIRVANSRGSRGFYPKVTDGGYGNNNAPHTSEWNNTNYREEKSSGNEVMTGSKNVLTARRRLHSLPTERKRHRVGYDDDEYRELRREEANRETRGRMNDIDAVNSFIHRRLNELQGRPGDAPSTSHVSSSAQPIGQLIRAPIFTPERTINMPSVLHSNVEMAQAERLPDTDVQMDDADRMPLPDPDVEMNEPEPIRDLQPSAPLAIEKQESTLTEDESALNVTSEPQLPDPDGEIEEGVDIFPPEEEAEDEEKEESNSMRAEIDAQLRTLPSRREQFARNVVDNIHSLQENGNKLNEEELIDRAIQTVVKYFEDKNLAKPTSNTLPPTDYRLLNKGVKRALELYKDEGFDIKRYMLPPPNDSMEEPSSSLDLPMIEYEKPKAILYHPEPTKKEQISPENQIVAEDVPLPSDSEFDEGEEDEKMKVEETKGRKRKNLREDRNKTKRVLIGRIKTGKRKREDDREGSSAEKRKRVRGYATKRTKDMPRNERQAKKIRLEQAFWGKRKRDEGDGGPKQRKFLQVPK